MTSGVREVVVKRHENYERRSRRSCGTVASSAPFVMRDSAASFAARSSTERLIFTAILPLWSGLPACPAQRSARGNVRKDGFRFEACALDPILLPPESKPGERLLDDIRLLNGTIEPIGSMVFLGQRALRTACLPAPPLCPGIDRPPRYRARLHILPSKPALSMSRTARPGCENARLLHQAFPQPR